MVDFKGITDLRDVITDFIYSKVNLKITTEEQREELTKLIYQSSEQMIERLKHQIEDDVRIFCS